MHKGHPGHLIDQHFSPGVNILLLQEYYTLICSKKLNLLASVTQFSFSDAVPVKLTFLYSQYLSHCHGFSGIFAYSNKKKKKKAELPCERNTCERK